MGYWTDLSIEYASQRNYLDELFKVYPMASENIRSIDSKKWEPVEESYKNHDNISLLTHLLALDHFPIKDSYVSYLRSDPSAIQRNPNTVNRLCGMLYEMDLNELFKKCSSPKETNTQIGPLFKRWINNGGLGIQPVDLQTFESNDDNAVLSATDTDMAKWCRDKLNYNREKGLDFVARFNKKYIIGEAKFITASGGNQDKSFADAMATLTNQSVLATTVAILDGVVYIQNKTYCKAITSKYKHYNILSALLLRDFLYSL
jgi:hypothetical protein